jgi:hypothetical protein
MGVRRTARENKAGVGTVLRVKAEMAAEDAKGRPEADPAPRRLMIICSIATVGG